MDDKITTIRLHQSVKDQLQQLKEYPRETDEELLIKIIDYLNKKEVI